MLKSEEKRRTVMLKLEVFDPAMCCSTGICGNSVDPRLVTFAADLEWLKKKGIDVIRHGLSFEPAEFVKNENIKATLQKDGNDCLPIIVVNNEIAYKGIYPTREQLAKTCAVPWKIEFATEEVAVPVTPEDECGPDCDCHSSALSGKAKKILFIVVVLAMLAIIGIKIAPKAHSAEATPVINSLNQIKPSQDVAFIYVPTTKNEPISSEIKNAMVSAQSTLESKNISTSLYTMSSKSSEYAQVASQTTPPAILTIYKGKGKNYVSGPINQTKLLQSYMTASMPGCGSGCPCHKK